MSISTPDRTETQTELREFMLIVRRALLLIVRYIETKYPV